MSDEDARDIETVDKFLKDLAEGRDELVPADVVHRILDGENPVRVWREHRGLTQQALADKAGISKEDLCRIEDGVDHGQISVLQKLAEALNLDLDDLTD